MINKKQTKAQPKEETKPVAASVRVAGTTLALTAGERSKLVQADVLDMSGRGKDKRQAAALRRDVARGVDGRAHLRGVMAGIAESVELEQARGGEVEGSTEGVVRMRSRDGLLNLLRAKKLTQRQYDVGMAFRVLHERLGGGLRSQLAERAGSGATSSSAKVASCILQAMQGCLRDDVERMVQAAGLVELRALRAVAGEGHCVRAIAGGGRAHGEFEAALVRALDIAAVVLVDSLVGPLLTGRER